MAERAEVEAWLEANGWRYSKAAKRFGLDRELVTKWGREARARARTRPAVTPPSVTSDAPRVSDLTPPPPSEYVALPLVDRIRYQIAEVRADMVKTDEAGKATDKLHAILRGLNKDLDAEEDRLRRESDRDEEPQGPEAELAAIRLEVLSAPEVIIEAIEAAINERRNPIRLVKVAPE